MTAPEELDRLRDIIAHMQPSCFNAITRVVDAEAGIVSCLPKRDTVVITAFGPTSALTRDFHERDDVEIWGLNNGYWNGMFYEDDGSLRVDRWFEIHQMHAQPADDLVWMNHCPVPLYVADLAEARTYGPMPNAVQFPYAQIQRLVGLPGPWWACTFAYEIALAIHEGFTTIVLLGMEFGTAREWIFERPNTLWWCAYAAGKGITVVLPHGSTFMEHPYRYGMDYTDEKDWCEFQIDHLMQVWGYARTPEGQRLWDANEARLKAAIPVR